MSAVEMLRTVEFVVDAHGNKRAVLLDYKVWEDAEEIRRLREAGEEVIPWQQAKVELRAKGIDV